MIKLPYTLLQEDSAPLNQQRSGLLSTQTAAGGAQIRNYADIVGLAQTGNIEIGASYNCSINLTTNVWSGRDTTDICWLEKWTDIGGIKEFWYAPSGAAGVAPVWQKVDSLDIVNGIKTLTGSMAVSGTVSMANATAVGHGVNLGQADGRYAAIASSLGYGQTWQNMLVTGPRAQTTTYTNTTGKPIDVKVISTINLSAFSTYYFYVAGSLVDAKQVGQSAAGVGSQMTVGGIVPAGATYSYTGTGLSAWWELR